MLIQVSPQPIMLPDAPPVEAGKVLRAYLKRGGMTQRRLAEQIGVDDTYVSQMVNDRVNWINSQYFPAIVAALGIRPDEVKELKPEAVIEYTDRLTLPTPPSFQGRFVHSFRLSRYGEPEGLTYVSAADDVPDLQVVILDSRSMETGGMLEHATLYVNPHERKPEDGRVYVIEAQGAHAVKRAALHDGVIWFYSDAPQYGTPPVQAGRVRVLGRVFRFVNPPHDA